MIPLVSENVKSKSMSHGPNESVSHESAYILALYAVSQVGVKHYHSNGGEH